MAGNWFEAILGKLFNSGSELELLGGLNFKGGIKAAADAANGRYDILLDYDGISPLLARWGSGSDGALSAGCGTVTLARDMYYTNLGPFTTSDSIRPNGFRIFCSGTLDLRGAPAGVVDWLSSASTAGIDASGQTAGKGGSQTNEGSMPRGIAGGAGGAGGAAGLTGQAGFLSPGGTIGYVGGAGGTGGDGGSVAGKGAGGVGAGIGSVIQWFFPRNGQTLTRPFTGLIVGANAPGGGGGGGGGGSTGAGGGGGGASAGPFAGEIWARKINRDSSTNAGALNAGGARGGNGGNGTTDGAGGGGGSASPGSGLLIVCETFIGDPRACVVLSGGLGGVGGNGAGGAPGGKGGGGGGSGTLTKGELSTNTWTYTGTVAGGVGGSASGSTGGAGGAVGTLVATL